MRFSSLCPCGHACPCPIHEDEEKFGQYFTFFWSQQSAHIRAERLELARSKEKRAQEMHTHKIQMDHIRVFLRNPNRNPNLFPESQNSDATPADTTTPLMTDLPITDHSPSSSPSASSALNSFLPPEVIANNRLYDQKLDSGEFRLIFAPGKHFEIEYCNPADAPALERMHKSAPLRFFEDPTRTTFLPGLRTFGKNPYIPPTGNSSRPAPIPNQNRNSEDGKNIAQPRAAN